MHMKNNYYIYIYIHNISIIGEKIGKKYKCNSTYEIHTKKLAYFNWETEMNEKQNIKYRYKNLLTYATHIAMRN